MLCPVDTEREGIDLDAVPSCPKKSALPGDCELVDASWDMRRLLLVCDDRWLSVPAPPFGEAVDASAGIELARGTDEPRAARWGPEQLAIWTGATGLRVVDVDAGVAKLRALAGVDELRPAILDEELERVLVLVLAGGAPHVVELAAVSGAGEAGLGPALSWSGAIEHAAFAPDGQRIALAGEGKVAVFSIGEAKPSASWTSSAIAGIAFRQDGGVLYLGQTRALPELAFDPTTGELAAHAQLDEFVLARLANAGMDPSWRWALDRDGVLLRALDGRSLLRFRQGQVLADNGMYTGKVEAFEGFVMRAGPPGSKVEPATKLSAALERPDLLELFLAGQPLH